MGTDIHAVIQRRDGPGAPWQTVYITDDVGWGAREHEPFGWLKHRNYTLFAVLAGVRNGYGFAGVPRHAPIVPIAVPRGLPDDAGPLLAFCHRERWGGQAGTCEYGDTEDAPCRGHDAAGEHSRSWVTLAELAGYPWEQPLLRRGLLTPEDYAAWKDSGAVEPDVWYTALQPARSVSEAEWLLGAEGDVILCEWTVPLALACGGRVLVAVIEALRALGAPDDVRLVFGFDS